MAESLDDRLAAATEWEQLLTEVRQVDGLHDFLRPPVLDDLRPTGEGPVVLVNVGRSRCHALIVTDTGVRAVELPGTDRNGVNDTARNYLLALQAVEEAQSRLLELSRELTTGTAPPEAFEAYLAAEASYAESRSAVEKTLRTTLGWLWDHVAGPVVRALDLSPRPDGKAPRLWWCPSGLLTLLPLHAAGRPGPDGGSLLDLCVPSYTPSLRALHHARRRGPATGRRMLAVTLPETPGQAPLPNVKRERTLLEGLFEPEARTVLTDGEATRAHVRSRLPGHQYFHFSCHGLQNLNRPSNAGLVLADGTLTVADLVADSFQAEFAFLSACKTATGGLALADEAITLAAALHHLGCRHVLATLWSVSDAAAAFVAERVYAGLAGPDGLAVDGSARALHAAVLELRALHPDEPSLWTPFTHTGP
ncbi:CHAT domain-containing protein [Kitasatospora sp. NPDC090091]|uniref:CHAT domain-containing protein n=1 Tax=Kitasatospora sp. NPDC090091 TaxID=3364081 RepID=UPI0038237190